MSKMFTVPPERRHLVLGHPSLRASFWMCDTCGAVFDSGDDVIDVWADAYETDRTVCWECRHEELYQPQR